jgi:phage recombination protein Bet
MSDFKTGQQLLEEERAAKATQAAAPAETSLAVAVSGLPAPMVEVVRRAICPKLTEDQFLLYLAICNRKGVDPMTEAYAFAGSDGRLAFGLRIDGMRALAMRTGQLSSRKVETIFEEVTVPNSTSGPEHKEQKLAGARCYIQRLGMTSPIVEEAWMGEYDQKTAMWARFPETMIRKVAESKCLRAAFPDALSGVYEPAELAKEGT